MGHDSLLLPDSCRLLHIGPHKTGTTALQGALRQARKEMRRFGVVYAGKERQHQFAALAVTGGRGMAGDPPATIEHWRRLVRQVRRAGHARVIVSSEYFDEADDETARRVVSELGGPKVHVLVTLRPLTKILPSAWQQYVRNRLRVGYDDWLRAMLLEPPYQKPTPTFWRRHHHDVLVARWASVAGPENVTVVVVDESDATSLLRLVEKLVGLPDGLLAPEVGWSNRSLTYGETEIVRHINHEFRARDWSGEMYREYVRRGLLRYLQAAHRPGPVEAPIRTPDWALGRVAEIGAEAARKIETLGVRVIGDLATLGSSPQGDLEPAPEEPNPVPAVVPAEVGAKAVVGTILAAMGEKPTATPPERVVPTAAPEPRRVPSGTR